MSVIAFLADWCTTCQRMIPDYIKVAEQLRPFVSAYAINCGANSKLCAGKIQGFPTLKFFPNGGKTEDTISYRGALNVHQIFDWVMPNHVDKVSDVEGIKAWVEENKDQHRALILTTKEGVSLKWIALGVKYHAC
ncbi:hypothetical protein APHAL10511_000279 [Amanita phalloides]|nr:hypothetical protein APHAL10511_000279 [Amanita phalloides]